MGQQSSQLAGPVSEGVNDDPSTPGSLTAAHGADMPSSAAGDTNEPSSEPSDLPGPVASERQPSKSFRNRKRKQQNKEEESARTLLEMKGWQDSTRDDAGDIVESIAHATRKAIASNERNTVRGSQGGPGTLKRQKTANSMQSGVDENRSPVDASQEPNASASLQMTSDPVLEHSPDGDGAPGATSAVNGESGGLLNGHRSLYEDPTAPLPTPPATNGHDEQDTNQGSQSAKKRRRLKQQKQAAAIEETAAAALADAASAANALIDPALTASGHANGTGHDVAADGDATAGNIAVENTSNQENDNAAPAPAPTPKKRKRRLPNPDTPVPGLARPEKKRKAQDREFRQAAGHEMSPVEFSRVTEFIESYRASHSLSLARMNERIHSNIKVSNNKELAMFWVDLGAVTPERDASSLQKIVRRRFHNYDKRGTWTESDDESLKQAHSVHPKQWKKIGEMIGRMAEDCRDRYRNYIVCGNNRRTGEWTTAEEEALTAAVEECMDALRRAAVQESGHLPTDFDRETERNMQKMISWSVVSEKMGNSRSRLQCQYKWKQMDERNRNNNNNNSVPEPRKGPVADPKSWRTRKAMTNIDRWMPGDFYHLLTSVRDAKPTTEEDISWRIIGPEPWRSAWTSADRRLAFASLVASVPDAADRPILDVVDELIEAIESERAGELHICYEHGPSHSLKGKRVRVRRKKSEAKKAVITKSNEHITQQDDNDEDEEAQAVEDETIAAGRPTRRGSQQIEVVIHRRLSHGSATRASSVELGETFMGDAEHSNRADDDQDAEERSMAARIELLRHA